MSQYLVEKYPDQRHATRVPVGPELSPLSAGLGTTAGLRASRPWRPEVDAIVYLPGELLIIEAKVHEYLYGLAKLPLYKLLIPETPELQPFWSLPIRMLLLVPRAAPWVQHLVDAMGVEVELYEPDWMTAYWEYRNSYWTAPYRKQRDALKAARRAAGLG